MAKRRTTPEQKEKHLEKVTSLSAAATKLNLMVANLEANIFSDTYTAEYGMYFTRSLLCRLNL